MSGRESIYPQVSPANALPSINPRESSPQHPAQDRLKILYSVGRILSVDPVKIAIPKILTLLAKTVPLETGIVMERCGEDLETIIWSAEDTPQQMKDEAVLNARSSFRYFTGKVAKRNAESGLNSVTVVQSMVTPGQPPDGRPRATRYVTIPLLVDHLPTFGIIQLQGKGDLTEWDIEFIDSLGDLFGLAIDRYYKAEAEIRLHDSEMTEGAAKLRLSQDHREELSLQRELRERIVLLLSHDLRKPLSAAKIGAQLIQRDPSISEDVLALAARIVGNLRRVDVMIGDQLDANLIRSGDKVPLKIAYFDLRDLAIESLGELSSIHGDRFLIGTVPSVEGFWDREKLRRVIETLCGNAIQYGSPNSAIRIALEQTLGFTELSVRNAGTPIAPPDLVAMLQYFRQGSPAPNISGKRWGIGLTLVRGVALAHHGTVRVESGSQSGTVFTIRLPNDCRARTSLASPKTT